MDVAGTVPESIPCHSCGSRLELAGLAAFTHMECPQCGALSVVPVQFGNFLLLNTLGIGGMGTVYRAMDLSLNRYVALKILRKKLAANTEFIEDFSREARAAAAVNHPNIAQVYSFGEHNNQYYLSIELLERGSLDDRIVKLIKLPERDVLEIGAQVAAGLRAAAERNLLHRDVKPGKHPVQRRGDSPDRGFRAGAGCTPAAPSRRSRPKRSGHPLLHRSGKTAGPAGRFPQRHVLSGRHAVPRAGGSAAV